MKRFIKWQDETNPKPEEEIQSEEEAQPEEETQQEGVNPTDIDSAGKDQDLDNTGVPFNGDAMNKLAVTNRERDELERDYQHKLWSMINDEKDDPNDVDPTKGPQGETPGGILNKTIRDYLMNKIKLADEQHAKEDKIRAEIPVKTTSTHFIDDKKGIFSPRSDAKSDNGNADKSTNIVDKE